MLRGLFLSWIALSLMALPLDTRGNSVDLERADSLRQSGKMVQALTLYRRLATETLTGCDFARIEAGMGHIQWNAGNASEARPHLMAGFRAMRHVPDGRTDTSGVGHRPPLALERLDLRRD